MAQWLVLASHRAISIHNRKTKAEGLASRTAQSTQAFPYLFCHQVKFGAQGTTSVRSWFICCFSISQQVNPAPVSFIPTCPFLMLFSTGNGHRGARYHTLTISYIPSNVFED